MNRLLRAALQFLTPGIILAVPAGMTADKAANFGLLGALANLNAYAAQGSVIVTAGTNTPISAAQFDGGLIRLTAGASGGFTITLPSTAAILSQLGPSIPTDGTYWNIVRIMNDAVAQTGTVTAGDASTTLNGTMTIATNTIRTFAFNVASATTVTLQNFGSTGA